MATRKQTQTQSGKPGFYGAKKLIDTPMNEQSAQSFMEYSMSVVFSRALPSISDGLKPSARRILYSMNEEGFLPEKEFVKCAKPVSSTMGNYHPHGDSSIYMALVKMAQPFYLNVPLVEGYGNFGDITGSGPAASRYTECKLSKEAMLMLSELKDKTVPMRLNYSGDRYEPEFLPTQFPNLLVNGSFGIAVGFASNFAPHNGGEAINAAKYLLKNPKATVAQLMKYIPGPDFPTGAQIVGQDGIISAYETGQGVIRLRSTYTIVPSGRGKHEIIFTELPYGAKTEVIINKIKEGLKQNKLTGIADVNDLTDHANGLKFVVDVKAGVNVKALVSELFRHTPLEESFGINNTCLVEGEPKVVGLVEMLQNFLDHRVGIVTRRTEHRRDKRATRLHLVEGLLKALANIDEVIKIVRGSTDSTVAQDKLMKKFKLDETQADYILALPLRRLTKFDQIELDAEKKKLLDEIKELNSILSDEEVLKSVILKELDETRKVLNQPRRSVIVDGNLAEHIEAAKSAVANASLEVADEPCGVFLSAKGKIVRSAKLTASKPVLASVETTTRGKLIVFTNKARAFRIDTIHVGVKEDSVENILPEKLDKGEKVIGLSPIELGEGKTGGIALGTRKGVVKVVSPTWPVRSDDFSIMNLEADDEIVGARWVDDINNYEFVFVTDEASLLTFPASKVRPQGLSGAGMAGIKLPAGVEVLSFNIISVPEKDTALVITHTGKTIKATPYVLYPPKGRATGGVRAHKFLKGETKLALSAVSPSGVLFGANGTQVPLPKIDNRRDGSGVKAEDSSLF